MPDVSRRTFCAAALVVGVKPQTVLPLEADQFVDGIGVCVHLASPPYATQFDRVAELAGTLGVRHFRDELRPDNDLTRWRSLHGRFGIRSHWLVSPTTNTVEQMLECLAALGPRIVSAVEGQNEGDGDWFKAQPASGGDWARAVVAYQRAIFRALRARYAAAALPILSPALLDYRPEDTASIAAAASYCDCVAIHTYAQGGQEPETAAPYASLGWYLRAFRDRFKPGAPAMATEAGYNNATGGRGISATASATYLPRLLLHASSLGLVRTFLYELMDDGADPADPEQNYGLLRSNAEPKPAYHALQELIGALADPGPRFRPVPVEIRAYGPSDLRRSVFQKRDGSVYVALWRAARAWDPVARRDEEVAPLPVLIAAGQAVSASALTVGAGRGWSALPQSGGNWTVPVAERVVLVRLAS